jgi:hypothetical protein
VLAAGDAGELVAADRRTGRPYYPPTRTGLRGSHVGSFETFHALKDKTFWDAADPIASTRETYDLAVVGAGISGLAAAYYYRQAVGAKARISEAVKRDLVRLLAEPWDPMLGLTSANKKARLARISYVHFLT